MAFSLLDSSPGVFTREIDNTSVFTPRNSSIIYLNTFARQGPTFEPIAVNSMDEYEQVFGVPESAAERYGYHAAGEILNTSNGILYVTRLPYGSGCGLETASRYTALVYPLISVSATEVTPCTYYSSLSTSALLSAATLDFPELLKYVSLPDYLESYEPKCDLTFLSGGNTLSSFEITHSKSCSGYFDTLLFKNQTFTYASLTAAGAKFYTNVGNGAIASACTVSNTAAGTLVTFSPFLSTNSAANYLRLSAANFSTIGLSAVNISVNNTLGYELTATLKTNFSGGLTNYTVPVELHFNPISGCFFDCPTVSALGLAVPESARWNFSALPGNAQLNDGNFYVYGEPIHRLITDQEYDLFKNGQFDWKCGAINNADAQFDVAGNVVQAGMVIVNEMKTVVDDDFSGFYVGVTDNYNINPSTDFNSVTALVGKYSTSECVGLTGTWTPIDNSRLNFDVTQPFNGNPGSLAEIIENAGTGDFAKSQNKASVVVTLFKLRPSLIGDENVKLDKVMIEKFTGSMDAENKIVDSYGGAPRSNFIEEVVNQGSNYLKVYVNPYLSENNCWEGVDGQPQKTVRMLRKSTQNIISGASMGASLRGYADKLYALGVDKTNCVDRALAICKRKDIGSLPCKLKRSLMLLDFGNIEVDMTLDAGLSTIWATRKAVGSNTCNANGGNVDLCYHYDDGVFIDTTPLMPYGTTPITSNLQDGWVEVYNVFNSYLLSKINSDGIAHFHVQDPLRQIFVNGKDYKISQRQKRTQYDVNGVVSDRFSTFSRNIVTPLKNLTQGVNSSYVTMYANWMKGYVDIVDKTMWLPSSNYLVPAFARVDRKFWPWYAVLGVDTGVLPNILDLAVNPSNQRERDFLYRYNLNPIYLDPTYGYMVMGQKTMLKSEKDTNRNNVRRGLLWLEKNSKRALIPFIGQPNVLITRQRIKQALQPLVDTMKTNFGLNDALIVCDERNNKTPGTCIKINTLVQVTKTTEFIENTIQVENDAVNLTQAFLF